MLIGRRSNSLGLIGATAIAPATRAATGFDWKRYSGKQLRFMVSVHPWTQWAQGQLAALQRDTGIKVNWEILYEDQLRQKLPLTCVLIPVRSMGSSRCLRGTPRLSRAGWYAPLR